MTTDRSEANVADVAEQRIPVIDEEREDLAQLDLDPEKGSVADVVEQSMPVPMDEEDA